MSLPYCCPLRIMAPLPEGRVSLLPSGHFRQRTKNQSPRSLIFGKPLSPSREQQDEPFYFNYTCPLVFNSKECRCRVADLAVYPKPQHPSFLCLTPNTLLLQLTFPPWLLQTKNYNNNTKGISAQQAKYAIAAGLKEA